jgi:VWFA-related protein
MHLRRSVAAVVFTCVFISACAVKGAQAPAAQPAAGGSQAPAVPASSTVLHANVNLVLVDVVVTDHDKPVHGLEQSRFHVYEDGHEQVIASFDEHRPPANGTAGSIPMVKPAPLPPHTYTNSPDYPGAGAVNVLLLDGLNTPVSDQRNVRLKMIEYLGKIKPGTSLAIFGLSSRLTMIAGFSTDLAALTKVLKSPRTTAAESNTLETNKIALEAGIASGAVAGVNGSQSTALVGETGNPVAPQSTEESVALAAGQFQLDMASFQADQRVLITLNALQQLARYLSAIPGRKNVIWFSGSFPLVIAPQNTAEENSFRSLRSYMEQVRETTNILSDARVSIYPVDARGLTSLSQFNAGNTTSPASSNTYFPHTNSTPFAEEQHQEHLQTENGENTMRRIAQDTGGKAYVETNDFADAVADVVENGSSYYTIGYVPERKQLDGQFHTFKVSVDQGSYKLAYRRGYYADAPGKPSPDASGQPDAMTAASMHGAPAATQIIFTAQVLAATDPLLQGVKLPTGPAGELSAKLKGPIERYEVNFTLSPGALSLDMAPDGTRNGKIELALIAYDADGNRVNYTDHQFQLAIKPELFERVAAKGISVLVPIDLPAGENSLRIVVSDLDAGRTGSLEAPVAVASK